jgi:hypothetical protein
MSAVSNACQQLVTHVSSILGDVSAAKGGADMLY